MKKIYFLLAMLMLSVSSAWGQSVTAQLVSGYGDPLTLTQFKALAGTSGRFAFVASSNTATSSQPRCDHWCGFTSTHNTTTLSENYLFYLEASGNYYKVKRASDGKYVSTSTNSTSFVETGGFEFELVNRDPNDATKAVTGEKSITFKNPSASNWYNANAVKLNTGAGAWTTYAVFGPLYIVTVNCIDIATSETFQTQTIIVTDGTTVNAPEIAFYTTKGGSVTVDGADAELNVYYTQLASVNVTYELYESDGTTLVTSTVVEQELNSDVNIPDSFKKNKSSMEANDYEYSTEGTIGTEDCTIKVTRTLKPDTYVPALPAHYMIATGDAANTMIPATSADDNDHWYVITQSRNGESAIYNKATYTSKVYRASTSVTAASLNNKPIAGNEKYLVRFIEKETGLYYIQFADGNYISSGLKTAQTVYNAGTYAFYNTVAEGTTFGWNKDTNEGERVDNNGAGNDLSFWGSGLNTATSGNNVWTIYPVEFISTVPVAMTLTDVYGTVYNGTYWTEWNGSETALPSVAYGVTYSNAVFSDEGGYSLTADIQFPFPISNETVKNATTIQSSLGESKWYANEDGKLKANNKSHTNPTAANQNNWNWYIYPEFNDGMFTFKLYNIGAQKYIPTVTATGVNTETELSTEAGSYQFKEVRANEGGFYQASTGKFLTINTSGENQNIWLWTATGGHMGSTMSFPEAIRLANMRITNAGWATFWAPFAVEIPEGVKAYAGEMKEGWIRMNEITEGIIPENTGVVVAKEVEGDAFSADLKPSALQPDLIIPTCYSGNTTSEIMNVPAGAYLLQKNLNTETNEYVVGWYKVEGEGFTLAPNRCYLAKNTVPAPNQSRPFIGFEPVDDATGINSIATEAKTKADGKYMVKGQIVVVKAGKAYYMNGTEVK